MDDDSTLDDSTSGESTSSNDGGSTDDQTSSETTATGKYYAACNSGPHPPWLGPNRDTADEAQSDADAHNSTCPDKGASVVYP